MRPLTPDMDRVDFDLFIFNGANPTSSWYSMQNKFELRVVEKEGGVVFCVTNINIYYFLENVNRNISLSQINTMSNQYNNTLLTTTTVS